MSELLSYSLDRLRKEPEVLRSEREALERGLQATSVSQYTAFLDAADCLTAVSNELNSVCESLDALLQTTPELASSCEAFSSNSAAVQEQYAHNKQLASSQATLLELLEVPALMDTCVRNGVYDEALDLAAWVGRLGLLHPDVPAVKLLAAQVSEVGASMLSQLLGRLKTSIQLPECLRIMGYLRRIGAFSEAQLRAQFLACRDEWMSGLVAEADDPDPYEALKRLTDVHRLHLFDAVMQYRAIFFDSAPGPEIPGAAGAQPGPNLRETAMLYTWVQHRLGLYLAALRARLPAITEGGNLASVIEHCMYCGSSLSRVGLDFQALLLPLFEGACVRLFAQHLSAAVDAFNVRLEAHKWVPLPAPALGRAKQAEKDRAERERQAAATAAAEGSTGAEGEAAVAPAPAPEDDAAPPYALMEHLPLAALVNGVLAGLNELRHAALLSVSRPLAGLLQAALESAAGSLVHYRHTHALPPPEQALFKACVRCCLDLALPYLSSAYGRVFAVAGAGRVDGGAAAGLLRGLLAEL